MPATGPLTPAPPRPRPRVRDPWTALRVVLVVVGLGMVVVAVLVGQRPASLADLRAAVDAGRVETVRVSEGLEPGATGYAWQIAVWRSGPVTHRTEVWEAAPGVAVPQDSRPVLRRDLADQLQAADPDLRVVPWVEPPTSAEVLGWWLPGWTGTVLLGHAVAVVLVLVGGPPPARATRWAWLWLSWPPIGSLAFLLLSGPFPGLPAPRPGGRRLTGGWAFLLSWVVVGALVGG
ncbi:hypothetical protein GCM10023328_21600 [Modestobacter marinus]|uniref:Uncharacterized protein n=1 Tax=Modestobacter marinus TaxID=477641 RepID=A0A846LKA6_9ACTN|nr:hypothetical protein [Modestobacter marinus]NIH65745.1 hypothetical protein [Modestobacter marinus]GGL66678.1 hypothetical protein GCM10011589_23810 [Modestobacter marinus]